MPRPIYCQRNSTRYAMNSSLDTLENRKILSLLGIDPRIHGVPAPSLISVLTELSPLSLFLFISATVRLTDEVWEGREEYGEQQSDDNTIT